MTCVGRKKEIRMRLNALRNAAIEALREDMRWNTFKERLMKPAKI